MRCQSERDLSQQHPNTNSAPQATHGSRLPLNFASRELLTQVRSFRTRLAQITLFAIVARLTLFVTRFARAAFGVPIPSNGTLFHAVCKFQKIWRYTSGALICFAEARLTFFAATFAIATVFVETLTTSFHAPLGSIRSLAFHACIL